MQVCILRKEINSKTFWMINLFFILHSKTSHFAFVPLTFCTSRASLPHLSMARTVFSASRGAIRILNGSLHAAETASGKSAPPLSAFELSETVCTRGCGKILLQVSCHFGNSIIRTIDGKILHKYKHPAAVFGCDWSQNNK